MQENVFNAAKDEGFEIRCGFINGFVRAKTEGAAFRKLRRAQKIKKGDYAILAQFRMVRKVGETFRPISRWFWQDPVALENTR